MTDNRIKIFKPLGQIEIEGVNYSYDCYYSIDNKSLNIHSDFVNTHGSVDKRIMVTGVNVRIYSLCIQKVEQNITLDNKEFLCGAKCAYVTKAFKCLKNHPVLIDEIESFLKEKGYPNMYSFKYQIDKAIFKNLREEEDSNSITIYRNRKNYETKTNFNIDMVKNA